VAKLIAVAGQKMADWSLISTVAVQLWKLGLWSACVGYQRLEKLGNGIKAVIDISWARSYLKYHKELGPTYLLEMVSHKTCLEPRDRVYAILGMTSLSFRNRIEISYSDGTNQHIWRTFIDCAKACIEEGHFPILGLVAGRERISDLPSWCPNFRSNPADLGRYSGREVLFAGNTTGLSCSKIPSIKTSRESDTLLATGFRVLLRLLMGITIGPMYHRAFNYNSEHESLLSGKAAGWHWLRKLCLFPPKLFLSHTSSH